MAKSEYHEIFAIDNKKEIDKEIDKYFKKRRKTMFRKGLKKIEVYDSPEKLKEKVKKTIDKYIKKEAGQGLENMAKRKQIEFEYRGFWIESEAIDQAENGHQEDSITYTSYVWHSQEEREALEDQIDDLLESYDSLEELEEKVKKAIDKYIKKNKLNR